MSWLSIVAWTTILLVPTFFLYHHLTRGIPSRLRPDQRPRSGFGVVPVDGVQQDLGTKLRADGVDLIFVHGLGSNPDTTWRARVLDASQRHPGGGNEGNGNPCWVTDFLVDEIPLASRRKTRIFFYNHDSFWLRDAVQTRLWNLAGNMLHHVQQRIRRTAEERNRSLVFVGHSYGGILIKQALVRANGDPDFAEISAQTKGILFLGTPHRGSSFTRIGSLIASLFDPIGSNASILSELVYDSLPLQDLHDQFIAAAGNRLQVYNFFEERKTSVIRFGPAQWTKFVVEEQSAKYSGATDHVKNIGLALNHQELNKFASRTDDAYGTIRDKILNLLPPLQQDAYEAYCVPLEPVFSYIPREELSQKIAEVFLAPAHETPSNAGEFQALVIDGMGGAGKTQLARRYIEEHRVQYGSIVWIDAHTTESVRSSFQQIATALKLAWDTTTAVTVNARLRDFPVVVQVMRWFSERDEADRRWLMVVDNADDTTWNVDEVIPRGRRGHVIVTSQHIQSAWFLGGQYARLNVGVMSSHEARTLLRKHTKMETQLDSGEFHDLYDRVAGCLGYLALAVDLAGLYLSEQLELSDRGSNVMESEDSVTAVLREYVRDYNLHQDALLKWEPFDRLSSYEKTVWTVWDTSLAAIEKTSQSSASRLLTFLAHFEGGQVQEELFRLASLGWPVMLSELGLCEDGLVPQWLKKMVGQSSETWDSFEYRQAILPLVRYGLVQRETSPWPGTVMHSLVQWRARKEGEQSGLRWELWVWLFVMAALHQTNLEEARPIFRRHMISHVRGMEMLHADSYKAIGLDEREQACALTAVAEIFFGEGQGSEAVEKFTQVVEMRKRVLGEEHPQTLISTAHLTLMLYQQQGRVAETEEMAVEVVKKMKRVLGEEHIDTLSANVSLALIYQQQRRWMEAEELLVEEMKKMKRVSGEKHSDTIFMMNTLAMIYWEQGRWSEAEELGVKVVETKKRVLGEEHPETLSSMNNLASTYRAQGRLSEAEELGVKVVKMKKRLLGEEHPETLSSMSNLAVVYRNQGRLSEAEELQVKVVKTMKRVLGEEHPETFSSMNSLAIVYCIQGRLTEAEELGVKVVETRKRVLKEEHPETLSSMNNLAVVYWTQGRREEAVTLMKQCAKTSAHKLGADHPQTVTRLGTLQKWRSQPRSVR